MKTKKQKWLWIAPLLIVLSGIINLLNPSLQPILRNAWFVLIPITLIMTILGINLHTKYRCETKSSILEKSQPCPKCNNFEIERVRFAWWGGFIGPQILHVGKCKNCGNEFNYKTGKKNIVAIIIYVLVLSTITIFIFFTLGRMIGRSLKNTNKNLTKQSSGERTGR